MVMLEHDPPHGADGWTVLDMSPPVQPGWNELDVSMPDVVLRVPELSTAEFHRKYVVGHDADLPAVGSFHG